MGRPRVQTFSPSPRPPSLSGGQITIRGSIRRTRAYTLSIAARTVLTAAPSDFEVFQRGRETEGGGRLRIHRGATLRRRPVKAIPNGAVDHRQRIGVEMVLNFCHQLLPQP